MTTTGLIHNRPSSVSLYCNHFIAPTKIGYPITIFSIHASFYGIIFFSSFIDIRTSSTLNLYWITSLLIRSHNDTPNTLHKKSAFLLFESIGTDVMLGLQPYSNDKTKYLTNSCILIGGHLFLFLFTIDWIIFQIIMVPQQDLMKGCWW